MSDLPPESEMVPEAMAEPARAGTLRGLSSEDWAWLAQNAKERQFGDGEAIVRQGDRVAALYILSAGAVRVEHPGEDGETVVLARLGRGAMLGEMSFVDTAPANVNVICEGAVAALAIDARVLAQMINGNLEFGFRFYRSVAHTLSQRLRATTALKQQPDRFVWV